VNEAGLTSARVAPAEGEATIPPSRPLEEAARPDAPAHLGRALPALVQVGLTLGAIGIAFATSLAGLSQRLTLGAPGLVPLISLLLAVGIAVRRRRPEPDIHDRYFDYILGLALLGTATAAMWFLPGAMSIFFWSWRLDMVWLPFFAAGAITLVGGARALWRYRLPIFFLFLAWPLPYVVARIPGGVAAAAIAGLGLILALHISLPRSRGRVGVGARQARGSAHHRAGGGLLAAGLVCGVAILTGVADRQLVASAPLLEADGQPKLAASSKPATSVDGLVRGAATDPPTTLPNWGSRADHESYRYGSAQATLPGTDNAGDAGIVVDLLAPGDGSDLALSPAGLATLQGYRLEASRVDDLGTGLAGHVERYLAPGARMSLLVVWWDWPVRSAAGAQRERVVVERLVPLDVEASRGDELLRFARRLVASMVLEASAAP
jgi:hypothetical protein